MQCDICSVISFVTVGLHLLGSYCKQLLFVELSWGFCCVLHCSFCAEQKPHLWSILLVISCSKWRASSMSRRFPSGLWRHTASVLSWRLETASEPALSAAQPWLPSVHDTDTLDTAGFVRRKQRTACFKHGWRPLPSYLTRHFPTAVVTDLQWAG